MNQTKSNTAGAIPTLAKAAAALSRCMDARPETRDELALPLQIICELLEMHAEDSEAEASSTPMRDPRLGRLAELEKQLAHMPAGERAAAIRERLGTSRSSYYRLRARVIQSQPVPLSPKKDGVTGGIGG